MESGSDVELLQELAQARASLELQVAQRIVGQKEIIEKLLIALLAGVAMLGMGTSSVALARARRQD